MTCSLVGYTGFVGGNLAASQRFDHLYNSKNISEAFGVKPELVAYCGVRAEKYLANSDPEADRAIIDGAIENIKRMAPKTLVLISTSDVYKSFDGVDENTPIELEGLQAYGVNRRALELWVLKNIERPLVVRLHGLYGAGMKKNFIYDMMTLVPSMLKAEKYEELCAKSPLVRRGYEMGERGFYKLSARGEELARMREFFRDNDFNSLSFTDSRAVYQFYNLAKLWSDINRALENNIRLINLTCEPVSAAELYSHIRGGEFKNELAAPPVKYDLRSVYAPLFGGKDGYIYPKEVALREVKAGVESGALLVRKPPLSKEDCRE